jgi:hypothetical protein
MGEVMEFIAVSSHSGDKIQKICMYFTVILVGSPGSSSVNRLRKPSSSALSKNI